MDKLSRKNYRLPEVHLEYMKDMVKLIRRDKTCRKCYERGFIGTNQFNEIIICPKCVNSDLALGYWKKYVRDNPDLHEQYKWALDDDNHEINETNEKGSLPTETQRHGDTEVVG